jgi:hypothetical protein
MKTIVKGLIGLEDMNRGSGTFQRTTSTGGTQTMTMVPLFNEGATYVGADLNNYWGTSDIGAQINAAYASLGANGGVIKILPNTNGAIYSFSTPIVFGTLNKFVKLQGLTPTSPLSGKINGGTVLNYTPTSGPTTYNISQVADASSGTAVYTGTFPDGGSNGLAGKIFRIVGFSNSQNSGYFVCSASSTTTITLSNGLAVHEVHAGLATIPSTAITYSNDGGNGLGDGYNMSQIVENLTIVNNPSTVFPGGTGNATVGIDFSNAGRLCLKNVLISGFGIGALFSSGANWSAAWYDVSVTFNNVGVLFYNGQENFSWTGGALAVNDVGFSFSGISIPAANSTFTGISIDSNVTYGIKETAGSLQTLTFLGCHFENFAGGSSTTIPHYIYTETASVSIVGGTAIDDDHTISDTNDWWFSVGYSNNTGSLANFFTLSVHGLLVQPAGRVTACVFRVGGRAFLQGLITNPTAVTAVYSSTLGIGYVTNLFQNSAGSGERGMEISGALQVDGGLTAEGTVTLINGIRGVTPNHQVFTSNGTFTIPTGITAVKVTVVGGGGAGGGSTGANMGGGGASGGCGIKWLTGLTPGNTLSVTVGTGGSGASGAAGGNGAASSVASGTQTITTITANGGNGGGCSAVPVFGTVGAAAGSGGDLNFGGNPSITGFSGASGCGAGSIFGGGGAAAGGGSGNAATAPGAGSGGAFVGSTQTGPNGQAGVVIFEWLS